MTENLTIYGGPKFCACRFRSQGHEPDECENFALSEAWMWQPDGGWRYVALCRSCNENCGQLSSEENEAAGREWERPRESGWDINEPATQLRRSRLRVE